MIRGLEGVAVFAGRAEVQVVGLALGEVMIERWTRERRKQRHDRRERKKRAECSDKRFVSHRTAEIIA